MITCSGWDEWFHEECVRIHYYISFSEYCIPTCILYYLQTISLRGMSVPRTWARARARASPMFRERRSDTIPFQNSEKESRHRREET